MSRFYIRLNVNKMDTTCKMLPINGVNDLSDYMIAHYINKECHAERTGNIVKVYNDYGVYSTYIVTFDCSAELYSCLAEASEAGTWKQKYDIVSRTALIMVDSIVRRINSRGC